MVSVLLTVKIWRKRDKGAWKILEHFYKLKKENREKRLNTVGE